jgi:hypothetical protein
MTFNLEGNCKILARTPHLLRTLLEGLPDVLARTNYGAGTWSPHEVVGHLIHGDRTDWIPRTRWILIHGEAIAFEPFDRGGTGGSTPPRLAAQAIRRRNAGCVISPSSGRHYRHGDGRGAGGSACCGPAPVGVFPGVGQFLDSSQDPIDLAARQEGVQVPVCQGGQAFGGISDILKGVATGRPGTRW